MVELIPMLPTEVIIILRSEEETPPVVKSILADAPAPTILTPPAEALLPSDISTRREARFGRMKLELKAESAPIDPVLLIPLKCQSSHSLS